MTGTSSAVKVASTPPPIIVCLKLRCFSASMLLEARHSSLASCLRMK